MSRGNTVMIELLVQNNFGDTRSGGLAGPTGLVIILLLVISTVLLIRNMNKRLRRLPERFEQPEPPGRTGLPDGGPPPPSSAPPPSSPPPPSTVPPGPGEAT